jgi:hypothetical protein
MAGDWIKWLKGLSRRREIIVLARKLNISKREAACACMEMWEWADEETTDGHVQGATKDDIDLMLGIPGFGVAIESPEVGWVRFTERGISFPRWDRHNSETAKKRALEQRKKKRQRKLSERQTSPKKRDKCPASVPPTAGLETETETETEKSSASTNVDALRTPIPPKDFGVSIPPSHSTTAFLSAWNEFVDMRIEMAGRRQKPVLWTERAARGVMAKLLEVSPEAAASALLNSVASSWQSVYTEKVISNANRPRLNAGQLFTGADELGPV